MPDNLVVRFPRELLDVRVNYITAVASPTINTTPESMLYWRIMCVLDAKVGGAVSLEFTAIRGRGIVALRHKSSAFPSDVLCSFPIIVMPPSGIKSSSPRAQRTLKGIIDIIAASRLTAYSCADDASDYIWWCNLVYKSLEGKYIREGTSRQFMEFIAGERERPGLRYRIPGNLKSGKPIPGRAQSEEEDQKDNYDEDDDGRFL